MNMTCAMPRKLPCINTSRDCNNYRGISLLSIVRKLCPSGFNATFLLIASTQNLIVD